MLLAAGEDWHVMTKYFDLNCVCKEDSRKWNEGGKTHTANIPRSSAFKEAGSALGIQLADKGVLSTHNQNIQ